MLLAARKQAFSKAKENITAAQKQVFSKAVENITAAQKKQKEDYDRKHQPEVLKVGIVVLLENTLL